VKTACGTAYNGVLKALDGYFILKEVPPVKKGHRKDRFYYEKELSKIDKRLFKEYGTAYFVLNMNGYYEGETNVTVIQEGFKVAYSIIEKIKP